MTQQETTFYQDKRVHITNARAIIDSKTYSMANITSVNPVRQPPKILGPIFMGIGGVLVALFGILMSLPDSSVSGAGAGCLGIGIMLIIVSVAILWLNKTQYVVVIGSSSGEKQALSSPDQQYVAKIVSALNESIVNRG